MIYNNYLLSLSIHSCKSLHILKFLLLDELKGLDRIASHIEKSSALHFFYLSLSCFPQHRLLTSQGDRNITYYLDDKKRILNKILLYGAPADFIISRGLLCLLRQGFYTGFCSWHDSPVSYYISCRSSFIEFLQVSYWISKKGLTFDLGF